VERQDLRSVLRLFAEIASSMQQEESVLAPDAKGEAEDCLQQPEEESWAPSSAR
jgi:hypothetical protein